MSALYAAWRFRFLIALACVAAVLLYAKAEAWRADAASAEAARLTADIMALTENANRVAEIQKRAADEARERESRIAALRGELSRAKRPPLTEACRAQCSLHAVMDGVRSMQAGASGTAAGRVPAGSGASGGR